MSVRIRLRRIGKCARKRPHFRITVFDAHRGRDGSIIEEIGFYRPLTGELKINKARFDFWKSKGAQPTQAVESLVKKVDKEKKDATKSSP